MILVPQDMRRYQVRAANILLRKPCLGLLMDMGLGKTVTVLTAIARMVRTGEIDGAWVLAPLKVADTVWAQEIEQWIHLWGLKVIRVTGNAQERAALLQQSAHIYLLNYEQLPWLWNIGKRTLSKLRLPEMLVLDESTYVKTASSRRYKTLKFRLLGRFKRRVILTGTPTPNSLSDLWGQIYMLDRGARLGTSYERFKERFFRPLDYNEYKFEPRRGAEAKIYRLIRDIVVRLDADDYVKMPQIMDNPVMVDLPHAARKLYDKHERKLFTVLSNSKEIEAVNQAVLYGQCHQLANGSIYDDPDERTWTKIHDAKLDALDYIIESLDGKPLLITYWFKHDLERLQARYKKLHVFTRKNTAQIVTDWNAKKLRLLAVHPRSAGHGLNMQFGGYNIAWFGLTNSKEAHDQLIGRLRRPNQPNPFVMNHYIISRNTVDEAIVESWASREHTQRSFLQKLREYGKRKGVI